MLALSYDLLKIGPLDSRVTLTFNTVCLSLCLAVSNAVYWVVLQLKGGQLTFLMVTFECIGKIQ